MDRACFVTEAACWIKTNVTNTGVLFLIIGRDTVGRGVVISEGEHDTVPEYFTGGFSGWRYQEGSFAWQYQGNGYRTRVRSFHNKSSLVQIIDFG